MTDPLYTYRARVIKTIDADTLRCEISLGFDVYKVIDIRLARINAPEVRTKDEDEKYRGRKAKEFVEDLLHPVEHVIIRTEKDKRSFNRYIGEVLVPTPAETINLSDLLLEKGHAEEYKG